MSAHTELLEQAEVSVLAAALNSPSDAALVVGRLSEEDFRRDAHRLLFRAVAACTRKGTVGTVEVSSWLIDKNRIDEVGGPVAVSQMASRRVSREQLTERLSRLDDAAFRRRMHQAAGRVRDAAADWQTPRDRLLGLAVEGLLEVQMGTVGQVVRLSDRADQVRTILKAGTSSRAVSTGWKSLDRHYRPSPGRWTLMGGIPGHGKSAFLDALMFNLADVHGWRFLVCSPEKQPLEQHMAQLVQLKAGRPLLNRSQPAEGEDVDEAVQWVDEHFSWVELGDDGRDVASLLSIARLEHAMSGFEGMVIDPWNELDHSRDAHLSETEHVSQSLTRIRSFARDRDVHTWLVAHPTKLSKRTDGTYPVPTPYDVAGSANWRNKADNALAIWRDHADLSAASQIHVQKIRSQPDDGREGMVELTFDPSTGMFEERSPA